MFGHIKNGNTEESPITKKSGIDKIKYGECLMGETRRSVECRLGECHRRERTIETRL